AHEEGMRAGERPLELVARLTGAVHHLDVRSRREQLEPRLGQAIRHHHAHAHASCPATSASSSSSAATVWSPMWPMRMVDSLRAPYPAPIVHPACFSAATIDFDVLPSGSLRQETVQLRRPSRGRYAMPCCSLHCSTRRRMASCRLQRASTPPSRSIRPSCASSAYSREIAGVLVGWCLVVASRKVTTSKYNPRAGSVFARSTRRSEATPSASPGGRASAFCEPVRTK